ncbi:MAG: HAMP domain-containing histidine kinase [Candidatus Obscuribacterales bacterium]|nr:HAMP domain-containing histidine kinase [Candidatus Obscuribacterales bacterium]
MRTLQKGFLLISVPVIAELLFVGMLLTVFRDSEEQTWRELRYRAETTQLAEMNTLFDKCVGVLLVYGVSRDPTFLKQYHALYQLLQEKMDRLGAMLSEKLDSRDSSRMERFNKLRKTIEGQMLSFESRAIHPPNLAHEEQLAAVNEGRLQNEKLLDETRDLFTDKSISGVPIAESLTKKRATLFGFIAFGVITNLLIAFVVLYIFAREFASRVDTLVDNARRLPRNEPLNERIKGSDELCLLDSVFHDMARELKENSERREQLMAMVSHDLRTPLLAANLSITLLQEGAGGPLEAEAVTLIDRCGRTVGRLIGLVNDILDLEKLRAGKMKIELGTYEISVPVQEAVAEVQALAKEKNISFAVNCAGSVVVDRNRIMQVLVNLLSNAIKFSESGSTIKVSTVELHDEEMIRVQIDDQGPGVPDDHKATIFLPYEQCPAGLRAKVKGTGLGLPICKFLIDLHRGTIGIEDAPVSGSRFWFTVPAAIIEEL